MLLTVAEGIHVRKSNSKKERGEPKLTASVSLAFCDSSLHEEDKMGKKSLEEIHTYAEFKHDPRASLPDSFTICSTIITTNCPNYIWPAFFTILDNTRTQFLAPISAHRYVTSLLKINPSKMEVAPQGCLHVINQKNNNQIN